MPYTYLEGANLRGANLEGANLEGANLEGANLENANLEHTNLQYEDIRWVVGNGKEIKNVKGQRWPIVYTKNVLVIGCQQHLIENWWKFSDEEISEMHDNALIWWKKWKPKLQEIIKNNPAV